jgi:hypothetical protein
MLISLDARRNIAYGNRIIDGGSQLEDQLQVTVDHGMIIPTGSHHI